MAQNLVFFNAFNLQREPSFNNLKNSSNPILIEPEWYTTWGTVNQDEIQDIKIDSSGNIYIAGYTNTSSIKKEDFLLIQGYELLHYLKT